MSAFIVGHDMIDLLATVAVDGPPYDRGLRVYHGGQVEQLNDGNEIGAALLAENVRSVNYRYNEDQGTDTYTFRRVSNVGGVGATYADVLNACACLRYQSCETPDYDQTRAAAILRAIERKAVDRIIGDDSPWTWTRDYQNEQLDKVRAALRSIGPVTA